MEKIRIIRIKEKEELEAYQEELIQIYKRAFGEPPWNEVFSDNEVKEWFEEMMNCSGKIILIMQASENLIGATFCTTIELKPDVEEYLPQGIDSQKVIYLAESFIDPAQQRKGLGCLLHKKRLDISKDEGYEFALQRTSEESGMYPLIQRTDFKEIGRQFVVSKKMIKGKVVELPDERVISLKKL